MKEKTRNTEVQTNEEEIGKLPVKQFRVIIVKMIKKKKSWKQNGECKKMQESAKTKKN